MDFPFCEFGIVAKDTIVEGRRPELTRLAFVVRVFGCGSVCIKRYCGDKWVQTEFCYSKYLACRMGSPVVDYRFHGAQGGGCMLREVDQSSCEGFHR